MCMNPSVRLALAKAEDTEGVDSNPVVGTDDVYQDNSTAAPDTGITAIEANPASPTGWQLAMSTATRKPTHKIRIPAYMKGLNTGVLVAPAYLDTILQSCGDVDYSGGTPAGEVVTWKPNGISPQTTSTGGTVTAAKRSFTWYDYVGLADGTLVASGTKRLVKMVGCVVSKVTITLTVGQWVMFEFDVLAQYVKPLAATTDLSGFTLDGVTRDFLRVNGAQQQLTFPTTGAVDLKANTVTWTVDFEAQHEEGDNSASGVACIGRSMGKVTASLSPLLSASNINDYANAADGMTLLSYAMAVGMTSEGRSADTGYTLKISAPQVQVITNTVDVGGKNIRIPAELRATSADAKASPLVLTFS